MDDKIRQYKMKTMLLEALFRRLEELGEREKDGKLSLEDSLEFLKLRHEIAVGNYSRVIELDSILDDLNQKSDEVILKYKNLDEKVKLYHKYLINKGLVDDFQKWVKRFNQDA